MKNNAAVGAAGPGLMDERGAGDERSGVADEASAVLVALQVIESETSAFAATTGLRCPDGCGKCCLSPDVETTAAEMLPMARALLDSGEAIAVLERIEQAEKRSDSRCVMFQPDPHDPVKGRCTAYETRPALCRLFGFSGRRRADGSQELSPCMVFSFTQPDELAAARAGVRSGEIPLPLMADLTSRAISAAPSASGRLRPINEALRAAVQRMGLVLRLEAETGMDRAEAVTVEVVEARVAEEAIEASELAGFSGDVDPVRIAEEANELIEEAETSTGARAAKRPDGVPAAGGDAREAIRHKLEG